MWLKAKYRPTIPAMPAAASAATHFSGTPAMKKTAMKVVVISRVWPISGWISSRPTVRAQAPKAIETPGTPCPFCASENIQAAKTIRPGLANSEGCRLNGPRLIQRAAPFTSLPMNGRAAMTTMAPSRASRAIRRTPRGDNREMTSMAAVPPEAQTIIRQE